MVSRTKALRIGRNHDEQANICTLEMDVNIPINDLCRSIAERTGRSSCPFSLDLN